jgi:proline dehydrogenase
LRLPTILARRFVAGTTAAAAVAVGERLNAEGIRATFDLLGEDVTDEEATRRRVAAHEELLRTIPDGLERNVSIKLTNFGLDISRELCLERVTQVVAAAQALDGFIRIDMEGSRHTQATLEVFRALRKHYQNVGIVLQAALHRTWDDVQEAVAHGDSVRLCKGAYKEPPSIAWTRMSEVRDSFRKCAHELLARGNEPAIATHDEGLIQDTVGFAAETRTPPSRYELQMLYGLRPRRWRELVAAGHRVRIYVPYGTHWLPYFVRRLRERRENVLFVLRSLLRG